MSTPPTTISSSLPPPSSLPPSSPHAFNPTTDIPSQAGKTFLITGATSGIGKQTAVELARRGATMLVLMGRGEKGVIGDVTEAAKKKEEGDGGSVVRTEVKFVEVDLGDLESVRKAAGRVEEVIGEEGRIDILMMNAGMMGGPPSITPQGVELHFATNHLGHAYLFKLLLPLLKPSPSTSPTTAPRIIWTASRGHKSALPPGGIAFSTLHTLQSDIIAPSRYTQSKLANVIYARQVALRYPHLVSISIHPEDVATDLFAKGVEGGGPEMAYLAKEIAPKVGVSVEEGAKNGLWAATSGDVESGRYYEPVGVKGRGSELSKDEEIGRKLWEWTEKALEGW